MTVKPIMKSRKEMDFSKKDIPSNNAPMPPQQPAAGTGMGMNGDMNGNGIQDHTHPEYDQALVKLQELESALANMQLGGVNQESMDGSPESPDNGNGDGDKNIKDANQHPEMKESHLIETIRKVVKEELTGEPERDITKKLEKPNEDNSDASNQIPQTTQPSVGTAPSGGGFDSDDKTNKEDGDATVSETPKPSGEYPKIAIKKNKLDLAREYISRAKKLMKEANEDPTVPQPGKTEDNPEKMDGETPNKSPVGGTEQINNKKRDVVKEVYDKLEKEIMQESVTSRKSLVGLSSQSNGKMMEKHQSRLSTKQDVDKTVKEYLQKAGHRQALRHVMSSLR